MLSAASTSTLFSNILIRLKTLTHHLSTLEGIVSFLSLLLHQVQSNEHFHDLKTIIDTVEVNCSHVTEILQIVPILQFFICGKGIVSGVMLVAIHPDNDLVLRAAKLVE